MRRTLRIFFVIALVCLFTIFFQRDFRQWHRVGQDKKTGDIYYYEERTLRSTADGVFTVRMKMERPSGESHWELFEVSVPGRTIRNLTHEGPVELIPLGSAADDLWRILSKFPPATP